MAGNDPQMLDIIVILCFIYWRSVGCKLHKDHLFGPLFIVMGTGLDVANDKSLFTKLI